MSDIELEYDVELEFERDCQLARMSDSELHEFAIENSPRKFKWTKKEELAWAVELLDNPNYLEEVLWDGQVQTVDECIVEVDGTCPHGYTSPLVLVGIC